MSRTQVCFYTSLQHINHGPYELQKNNFSSTPVVREFRCIITELSDQKFDVIQKHSIQFFQGVPDKDNITEWFGDTRRRILVLDDLMADGGDNKEILNLFTQYSHYMNVTVCYLCQAMFPQGKYAKTISTNAQYIVAFKNARDKIGLRNLLLQINPTDWCQVIDVFNVCTDRSYGYLCFDVHPASRDSMRLVSHLLKHEGCMQCYR